jgi:hypothetical protein
MMRVIDRLQCHLTDVTLIPLIVLSTLGWKIDVPRESSIGGARRPGNSVVRRTRSFLPRSPQSFQFLG